MATLVATDESSQKSLLPAAANTSSADAAGKNTMADAGSSAKKPDSKPTPEPKPQVCTIHEWCDQYRCRCVVLLCRIAADRTQSQEAQHKDTDR